MADIVRTSLASDGATVVGGGSIDPNATDYSTTVNPIKAANVDAVYFGGYYDAAARLLKQMRDAGVQAKFVSDDGTKDPKFVSEATAADANGAYVTCACRDVSGSAAGKAFDTAYQSAFNTAAGTYSAEGYDAANVILTAIGAGNTSSLAINNYLASHTFNGITKTIKFDPNGDISGAVIYVYEVQNGTINFLGSVASLT
ncbi:MAG: branched-chain amino acid ABC transporter substrate-binding protein [Acidimicrobiales bacterium]